MDNNLNRHRLLKILSVHYIKSIQNNSPIGISWDELMQKMNCTMDELLEISIKLFDENEVAKHDAYNIKGIFAEQKGVAAYTTKKYKRENSKLIFDQVKNWIQILIPIISLIVTLYVVIVSEYRIDNRNIEINEFNKRLNDIENRIQDINIESREDTLKSNDK